jgi:hypothetical protein
MKNPHTKDVLARARQLGDYINETGLITYQQTTAVALAVIELGMARKAEAGWVHDINHP